MIIQKKRRKPNKMKEIPANLKIIKNRGFWQKFSGFMLKKSAGYALLFENCSSVHTFFMRFKIDIVFLDKDGNILSVKKNVKPWRIVLPVKRAYSILEIPSSFNEGSS